MLKSVAGIFGTIMLLVGILGFIPAFTEPIAGSDHELLLGIFEVNAVHNIIHIATGILAIAAASATNYARRYFQVFGVVYGLVLLIGLIQGDTVLELFPVNAADHVLHAAITALALYFGFAYRESTAANQ